MFFCLWSNKSPESKVSETTQEKPSGVNFEGAAKRNRLEYVRSYSESLPVPLIASTAFGLGFACTIGGALLYIRYGRRIRNSDWVTPDLFQERRWIRGVVTSVGDADNFRLFHTPSFGGWRWPFKFRLVPTSTKELKDETIHIRIAGVDAPEAAHFGKPEQPHAAESLAWLRQKILHKVVYCQLVRRDQYSRVVANVHLAHPFLPSAFVFGKNLPLEMLRAGCVTTYEQAGAEYGDEGKEVYLRVEAKARAARRGMWAKGVTRESPAEYKRRYGTTSPDPESTKQRRTRHKVAPQTFYGWFSRLF